jgi:hypothetical protein
MMEVEAKLQQVKRPILVRGGGNENALLGIPQLAFWRPLKEKNLPVATWKWETTN